MLTASNCTSAVTYKGALTGGNYLNAARGDSCAGFQHITGVTFCRGMTNSLKKIRKRVNLCLTGHRRHDNIDKNKL